MAQRPFPVYVRDWRLDPWVRRLRARHDFERLGVYLDLLFECWEQESIPGAAAELALLVGLRRARFERLWDDGLETGIRWKFVGVTTGVVGGEPGERLYNVKQFRTRQAQDTFLARGAKSNSIRIQFEKTARKPARKGRSARASLHELELNIRRTKEGTALKARSKQIPRVTESAFEEAIDQAKTRDEVDRLWTIGPANYAMGVRP